MPKFSDRYIGSLKPEDKLFDVEEGNGFGIRVRPTGTKSFYYRYMINGKSKRMMLGNYPGVSLSIARKKYNDAYKLRQQGYDPALESRRGSASTVSDLIKTYIDDYAKVNKLSWKEDDRILKKDVDPEIGHISLQDVRRGHIKDMLAKIQKRGPNIAWQTLKIVRKMFNYGLQEEIQGVDHNPCQTITINGLNPPRERNLTFDEVVAWWRWVDSIGTSKPIVNGLKFMLVTLQRTEEVFGMPANEINGDWWEIKRVRTKTKMVDHRVYLTPLAKSLLIKKKGLVFPSAKSDGLIDQVTVGKAVRRFFIEGRKNPLMLNDKEKIDSFVPRDLRRTGITRMAELGIDEHVIGKVANHADYTVTGRVYNKYRYDEEKKRALIKWSDELCERLGIEIEEKSPGNQPGQNMEHQER